MRGFGACGESDSACRCCSRLAVSCLCPFLEVAAQSHTRTHRISQDGVARASVQPNSLPKPRTWTRRASAQTRVLLTSGGVHSIGRELPGRFTPDVAVDGSQGSLFGPCFVLSSAFQGDEKKTSGSFSRPTKLSQKALTSQSTEARVSSRRKTDFIHHPAGLVYTGLLVRF